MRDGHVAFTFLIWILARRSGHELFHCVANVLRDVKNPNTEISTMYQSDIF